MANITEVRDSLTNFLTVVAAKDAVAAADKQAAVEAAVAAVRAENEAELDVLKTALDEAAVKEKPAA